MVEFIFYRKYRTEQPNHNIQKQNMVLDVR